MAQKTRGVIQILLNSMFKSAGPKIKPKFMGEDYYGTKYYEEPPESSGRKTRGRFFEPANPDDFMQELPAEWEAWLRYRRSVPPTTEETEANYRMMLTKRENAAKLEIEYRGKALVTDKPQQHASASFPVYKEYEDFGRNYNPYDKNKKKPE